MVGAAVRVCVVGWGGGLLGRPHVMGEAPIHNQDLLQFFCLREDHPSGCIALRLPHGAPKHAVLVVVVLIWAFHPARGLQRLGRCNCCKRWALLAAEPLGGRS